jgi:hypothetical protein
MDMQKYNWIMYLHTPMPGDRSVTLRRVTSLTNALLEVANFELATGFRGQCGATLYPYSEENWRLAEEYATIGTPFDYPVKLIERGPRGGMVIVNV